MVPCALFAAIEELARLQLNVQQLQSESASVSQREESDRQEAAELEAQIKELRKTQESIPEEQRQLRSGNEADNAKVETRRARTYPYPSHANFRAAYE